ncbi:ATP-binding protein [Nitrosomonas sp. HPC101]|uniref:ATP-binding protein n=1 Tax=Nitrosomonas sp. HPC101 TaxID=1658667 RepID=UPI001369DA29|nr:ATP-binding protein [Nitrosomonas sp. HPC101]MXS85061.1 ATP-binding protein [Nitrosomonas sp. HPC101]
MNDSELLFQRLDRLLTRIENAFPARTQHADLGTHIAFRWRKHGNIGFLQAINHPHTITPNELLNIEEQKQALDRNTQQFVSGFPANNVLLTGARGTGKSSLIKALLNRYADQGLRMIEVDKQGLTDLPDIVELIDQRPERFILYCDDLSFEADEPGYKALKVILDGSISTASDNVLVYATSNRRHLISEFMHENLAARHVDGEIHPGETTEEKISLSERFGLWLSFYPFDQEQYLEIVQHWLLQHGISRLSGPARQEALRWALARGSRNGRVARQFARDWAGQHKLAKAESAKVDKK